jgi:hypothetical protein
MLRGGERQGNILHRTAPAAALPGRQGDCYNRHHDERSVKLLGIAHAASEGSWRKKKGFDSV